jgi:hypothetical protein
MDVITHNMARIALGDLKGNQDATDTLSDYISDQANLQSHCLNELLAVKSFLRGTSTTAPGIAMEVIDKLIQTLVQNQKP